MPIDGIISRLNVMNLSRNSSIFVEGVIANFFFSIGFILSEVLKKGKKYKLVYLIAIISTFTTSGFLVVGLFILYTIIKLVPKNIFIKLMKYFLYVVATLLVVYLIILLITDKADTMSGNNRHIKIINELEAFLRSPIYGNGINAYTKGSSNAISAVAADGGVILFMIYYFPLIKATINSFAKLDVKLLIFIALFFLLGASVVQYTTFMLISVALSWEIVLVNKKNSNFLEA